MTEPPTGETPPPPGAAGECPRCGTPYAPRQEYCLECGLRLPVTGGVVGTLANAWRRRLPYYPGDWIWPVLVAFVIAAIAAAVAIAATRSSGGGKTLVATTSQGTVAGSVTTVGPTGPGTSATPTVPTSPAPPPPPPPVPARVQDWPAGKTGYTVVLNSVPTSSGRAPAVRLAKSALKAGLTNVGVLDSSSYSSLHPGYYVVFSGIFSSLAEAQDALASARSSGYTSAYARPITP
ncbi:MAG TPA: SPOR domain-containing protein [Gaiellaceae bacterium]|nr:SPOR domain-containing protein [Gaiellaceae bacterium]